MTVYVVALDLDGVIVKTNFIKYAAMLSLFSEFPDQQGIIGEFILANGGVPRRAKFAHLLRHTLRTEPPDALLSDYLRRYALQLQHQLALAPMVEGVGEFIALYAGPRYVCSSAPDVEVHEQLFRRSLGHHFSAVYGGTTPKPNALRAIAASHAHQPLVFFGDSVDDYEASHEAGVGFVGVVCERDNFQGMDVIKLRDFAHRAAVEEAMLLAARLAR